MYSQLYGFLPSDYKCHKKINNKNIILTISIEVTKMT